MSNLITLFKRNKQFAKDFNTPNLPMLPKLGTVVLTCADSRVDPAHIFKLDLGESLVMRNTGGRVTQEIIKEIASIVFMVSKAGGDKSGSFELIIMHHTDCGAERFANPELQHALKKNMGIDVSSLAITDHEKSLYEDIECLRNSPIIPGYVIVSGCIYDVKDGSVREIIKPAALSS